MGQPLDTAEVLRRFNQAFHEHDPTILKGLVAGDCVMESIQPAPDGTRYEGHDACLAFWEALAADRTVSFEVEETVAMGEHATIRWRLHFGEGESVRGATLLRIRDGQIVEALGYSKVPDQSAPLPE